MFNFQLAQVLPQQTELLTTSLYHVCAFYYYHFYDFYKIIFYFCLELVCLLVFKSSGLLLISVTIFIDDLYKTGVLCVYFSLPIVDFYRVSSVSVWMIISMIWNHTHIFKSELLLKILIRSCCFPVLNILIFSHHVWYKIQSCHHL